MNKYFKGYITRENAVKVLCRETCHPGIRCPDTYCVEMWDKFKDIPNEDVRPVRRGKWKRKIVDNGFNADWVCNECGYRVKTDFVNFNYCPNCGADMRGEDDE